jgi:UDP-GlcNAc:undecaprenyl-phosphate GlcNAc-1-phosphate transferase
MKPAAAAILVAALSLAVALLLTPAVRALAGSLGLIARPTADRWHRRPTALMGGIAIAAGTLVGVVAWFALLAAFGWSTGLAAVQPWPRAVAASATFMFGVGLVDDLVGLRPQLKFILQLLAGVVLVGAGATFALTPWYLVNVLATVFWFVALTNAFNLLDNMDGVAAGVGAIAAIFLGLSFAFQGAWLHAAAAWSLAGAAVGFLRYNFHPASIFMGDAGSLFIGSLLAGLVVTSPASVSGSLVAVLFVPLAIVAVPIVDTSLVTITRTLNARGISQGGRDHSTHRLVALGLREPQVALLLYGFAVLGGGVGLLLLRLDLALGLMLGTIFLVALSLLAAYLGRLQVGYPDKAAGWKPATVVATELLYKRRLAAMLLDVVLVATAYYGAFRLKFEGGAAPPGYMDAYEATLGIVIAVKVIVFGSFGMYRGAWRYTSMVDLYRTLVAIGVSSTALYWYVHWRVPALATSNILYIDALLTAALVFAARLSFRSLELMRRRLRHGGERVAIYGAGDGGELALRELLNNGELGLQPFCFLDDDPRKHGEQIHGVPVLGGLDSLAYVAEHHAVRRIIIATKKLPTDVLRALGAYAGAHGLQLLELDVSMRPVHGNGDEGVARVEVSSTSEETPKTTPLRIVAQ